MKHRIQTKRTAAQRAQAKAYSQSAAVGRTPMTAPASSWWTECGSSRQEFDERAAERRLAMGESKFNMVRLFTID